jgi:uncharacterized membrane protein
VPSLSHSDASPDHARAVRWWENPRTWLASAVLAYIGLSIELSGLRLIEFQSSNYDLGLFQQALWSASHGHGFFESADFSFDGASSLLRIHPALVLFPLAFLYGTAPGAWTLLAVQSTLTGSAAVPLFLLTRDVTGSPSRALTASLLYLAWTPTLASNLFDFHLEAFLPVELFTFFLLWNRGRYFLGGLAAMAAMLSFEAGAVFTFLSGLSFALPSITRGPGEYRLRHAVRPVFYGFGRSLGRSVEAVRSWIASPAVRASLVLMLVSVATFVLLLRFEGSFTSLGPGSSAGSLAGVLQGGPPQYPLSWANIGSDLVGKVVFWIALLGLVAFIPLWAARTLPLLAPWVVASMFGLSRYSFLGSQYGYLYAFPVFIGVAYGLRRFPETLARLWPTGSSNPELLSRQAGRLSSYRRRRLPIWSVAVGLVICFNIILGPADPLVQNILPGNGYHVSYSPAPGFASVDQLATLIPGGASLLASDDLMPVVADDVNAYGIYYQPVNLPYLPFDSRNLPQYVLLSEAQSALAPSWLVGALSDPSQYGVRATVGSSAAGIVLLYQKGYSGPVLEFQPVGFPTSSYTWPQVSVGTAGRVIRDPAHSPGIGIGSDAGVTGIVWYGPYVGVPGGGFEVSLLVRTTWSAVSLQQSPNASVLEVDSSGFASPTLFKSNYSFDHLGGGQWTILRFHIEVRTPLPRLEVRGYQLDPRLSLELGSVTIAPA